MLRLKPILISNSKRCTAREYREGEIMGNTIIFINHKGEKQEISTNIHFGEITLKIQDDVVTYKSEVSGERIVKK